MGMAFVGVDPGLDGALCFMDPNSGSIKFVDMPTLVVSGGKKNRREYDVAAIAQQLAAWVELVDDGRIHVAIEKQQVMPARREDGEEASKGSFGHFQTGLGFGILIGVTVGLGLPYETVAPVSWKATMCRDMPKGKDVSRLVALRLFPHLHPELARKKDHARADALLVACYVSRRFVQ